MLSPEPRFDCNFPVGLGGGSFALPCAVVNLRALIKGLDNESAGSKAARQDMNFVAWVAWTIAFGKAMSESSTNEDLSYATGSFANGWMAHFIGCVIVHTLIVRKNWDPIRRKLHDNLFKHELKDKVDVANAILLMMYGTSMFLAWSLRLGPARSLLAILTDFFGLLTPLELADVSTWGSGLDSVGSGCFGLAIAAVNLPAFAGPAEDPDYAKTRRYCNLVFWCALIFAMSLAPESGSFFGFWTFVGLTMIVLGERGVHGGKK